MKNNIARTGGPFGNGKFHQYVWVCLSACGGINHAELKILDAKLSKKRTTVNTHKDKTEKYSKAVSHGSLLRNKTYFRWFFFQKFKFPKFRNF